MLSIKNHQKCPLRTLGPTFRIPAFIQEGMDGVLRYRSKNLTAEEVQFIRTLIAQHPILSRRALSTKLCEAWRG